MARLSPDRQQGACMHGEYQRLFGCVVAEWEKMVLFKMTLKSTLFTFESRAQIELVSVKMSRLKKNALELD